MWDSTRGPAGSPGIDRDAWSRHGPGGSQIPGRRGDVRVQANSAVVILDGLLVASEFGLRMAAAEVRRGVLRVQADRAVVIGDGFLVAAQSAPRVATLEGRGAVPPPPGPAAPPLRRPAPGLPLVALQPLQPPLPLPPS